MAKITASEVFLALVCISMLFSFWWVLDHQFDKEMKFDQTMRDIHLTEQQRQDIMR